jgi:prevent-host-death family protein
MTDFSWSVAEAKSRFSELIARTHTDGPQTVTRHGKACVVIVSAADWASHAEPARSLVDVLLDPDVRGVLTSEEATLFHRDDADTRPSPVF